MVICNPKATSEYEKCQNSMSGTTFFVTLTDFQTLMPQTKILFSTHTWMKLLEQYRNTLNEFQLPKINI